MNPASILRDPGYNDLKTWVLNHTGLAYYSDKNEDLATRMARRMTARNVGDCSSYLQLIHQDLAEMDCLVGELTIGETYFFRQKEHFNLLADTIIPELIARNNDTRALRIWSAGCATGAEPYSLAVLLARQFPEVVRTWNVSILATDINVDFLAQARTGVFSEWALRETPPEVRALCFENEGKKWRLREEYRKLVTFRYHNLAARTTAPFGPFDAILCRNVLIYFSTDLVEAVVSRLYDHLDEGGWLLVGHAESSVTVYRDFQAVSSPAGTVYRRFARDTATPVSAPAPVWQDIMPELPKKPRRPESPSQSPTPKPLAVIFPFAKQVPAAETLLLDDVRLLADSGCWKLALEEAEKLASADPLNAPTHFTLGLILEHDGAHERAAGALGRAIYLDRSFALAHYHLAATRAAAGDMTSAKRSFMNALRLAQVMAPAEPLAHGDGITAGELKDLADMHLQLIANE